MKEDLQKKLQKLEAILWDFDGVFYKATSDLFPLFDKANSIAASNAIPSLSFEEAHKITYPAFRKYKDNVRGFLHLAENDNLDKDQLRSNIFTKMYEYLFEKTINDFPALFSPNKEVIKNLDTLSNKVKHCIISQSCAEHWVIPALKKLKVYDFLNKEHIFGLNHFKWEGKSENPTAILLGMKTLGSTPDTTAFVEDSLENLQMAKDSCKNITTVWISEETEKPDCVDIVIKSQAEFLDLVIKAKSKPETVLKNSLLQRHIV